MSDTRAEVMQKLRRRSMLTVDICDKFQQFNRDPRLDADNRWVPMSDALALLTAAPPPSGEIARLTAPTPREEQASLSSVRDPAKEQT